MPNNRPSSSENPPNTIPQKTNKMSSKDNICRVCLQEGNIPIYGNEQLDDVSEDLNSLANIKVTQDDTFPKHLCYDCYSLLQSAVELRRTAMHSQEVLQGHIVTSFGTGTHESPSPSDPLPTEWLDVCYKTEDDDTEVKEESTFETKPTFDVDIYTNLEPQSNIQPSCGPGTSVSINEVIVSKASSNAVKTASDAKVGLVKIKNTTIKKLSNNLANKILSNKKENVTNKASKSLIEPEKNLKQNKRPKEPCPICGKVYLSMYMKVHLEFHSEDSNSYICAVCGKGFKSSVTLYQHKRAHSMRTDNFTYKCSQCSYSHWERHILRRHEKIHTVQEKPFQCDICQKSFTLIGNLRKHVLSHEGPKFKCNMCEKRYTNQCSLNNHIKVVHKGGIRDQICETCGAAFMTRSKLLKHERKVHKRKSLPLGRRPCYLTPKYQSEENSENKI